MGHDEYNFASCADASERASEAGILEKAVRYSCCMLGAALVDALLVLGSWVAWPY